MAQLREDAIKQIPAEPRGRGRAVLRTQFRLPSDNLVHQSFPSSVTMAVRFSLTTRSGVTLFSPLQFSFRQSASAYMKISITCRKSVKSELSSSLKMALRSCLRWCLRTTNTTVMLTSCSAGTSCCYGSASEQVELYTG